VDNTVDTGEEIQLSTQISTCDELFCCLTGWLQVPRLKGADGPVLTLTEVSDYDCGIYMCEVENESGKVSSEVAKLEVGRFTAKYILHNYLLVSIPDLYLP